MILIMVDFYFYFFQIIKNFYSNPYDLDFLHQNVVVVVYLASLLFELRYHYAIMPYRPPFNPFSSIFFTYYIYILSIAFLVNILATKSQAGNILGTS